MRLSPLEQKLLFIMFREFIAHGGEVHTFYVERLSGTSRYQCTSAILRLCDIGYLVIRSAHLQITQEGVLFIYNNRRNFQDLT